MGKTRFRWMVTIFLLVWAVRAESMPPTPADSGTPPAAVSSAPTRELKLMGRWHRGPVYSSAVAGKHVFFGSGGTILVLNTQTVGALKKYLATIS